MTKHSIYPTTPSGSRILLKFSGNDLTVYDRLVVYGSSLFFVGGVFWVPLLFVWALKKVRTIPKEQTKRRALYTTILLSITGLYIAGPHRNPKVGELVRVHKWRLWKSWCRFFALEVVADHHNHNNSKLDDQAILGISPHGIFPFGLAFAALSETSQSAFGKFQAVVASATQMIPWVRDVLKWVRAVDASRPSVDRALSEGRRIGLAPGGIAEMFEGYPKPSTTPNEEYIIIRKGIFRLAMKHKVPMIPVYCFGSTKLLKRVQFPALVEKISLLLRTSLVLFFGQFGLPIPFRQRLLYVMGMPIHPPTSTPQNNSISSEEQLEEFVSNYCNELTRCFDRHKESYGWASKTLNILRL